MQRRLRCGGDLYRDSCQPGGRCQPGRQLGLVLAVPLCHRQRLPAGLPDRHRLAEFKVSCRRLCGVERQRTALPRRRRQRRADSGGSACGHQYQRPRRVAALCERHSGGAHQPERERVCSRSTAAACPVSLPRLEQHSLCELQRQALDLNAVEQPVPVLLPTALPSAWTAAAQATASCPSSASTAAQSVSPAQPAPARPTACSTSAHPAAAAAYTQAGCGICTTRAGSAYSHSPCAAVAAWRRRLLACPVAAASTNAAAAAAAWRPRLSTHSAFSFSAPPAAAASAHHPRGQRCPLSGWILCPDV